MSKHKQEMVVAAVVGSCVLLAGVVSISTAILNPEMTQTQILFAVWWSYVPAVLVAVVLSIPFIRIMLSGDAG